MYFEKQNNAVALQEEAYKWSVSDMWFRWWIYLDWIKPCNYF
jgi:hypothetical protein